MSNFILYKEEDFKGIFFLVFFFLQCLASVSSHSIFPRYGGKQDLVLFSPAICTKACFPWDVQPLAIGTALVAMKLEL